MCIRDRRIGRPSRARLVARPQGRDERDRRREDDRAARRQSRRRQAYAQPRRNRRTRPLERAHAGISGLDDRAPIRPEIAAAQRLNAAWNDREDLMGVVRWGVLGVAKIATEKVIPAMQRGEVSRILSLIHI